MIAARVARRAVLAALVVGVAGVAASIAQDAPPTAAPAGKKASALSREAVGVAVSEWVKKDAKLKGGFFLLYDESAKKPVALTMDKVHDDRLTRTGEETFVCCTEFKSESGAIYDVDIFMEGATVKDLVPTEVAIHKADGAERYKWQEEEGTWKRAPK